MQDARGFVIPFALLVVQDTAVEKQLPLPEWAAGKGGWLVGVRWADYSAPEWQHSPCVPHKRFAAECTCFPSPAAERGFV